MAVECRTALVQLPGRVATGGCQRRPEFAGRPRFHFGTGLFALGERGKIIRQQPVNDTEEVRSDTRCNAMDASGQAEGPRIGSAPPAPA